MEPNFQNISKSNRRILGSIKLPAYRNTIVLNKRHIMISYQIYIKDVQ